MQAASSFPDRPTQPMNILICTLGSWALIPEVYGFLAPGRLPLYREHPGLPEFERLRRDFALAEPNELWVCTSCGATAGTSIGRLRDWHGLLTEPPVLRIWQAGGTDELTEQAECRRMQELIVRVCLLAHERAGGAPVVLSLAGGRKTMSADLQWAGSVFGCTALLHVVAGDLPKWLREPKPGDLTRALPRTVTEDGEPRSCVSALNVVVVGQARRSELLDVDLDGAGAVSADRFPLPLAADREPAVWLPPEDGAWLGDELRRREREGSQLLGNYLSALSRDEHHENWRSLYRLPPRVIERLRATALDDGFRGWLRALPKADLHRHLGGCLELPQQRRVGRAVWENLTDGEHAAALEKVGRLLRQAEWPWDWADALKSDPEVPRPHAAAALLVEASDELLQRNLYGTTKPRVALKTRHPQGFSAYERPGELSGSALLAHGAALETYAACVVEGAAAEGLAYTELRGSPQKYGDGLAFLDGLHAALYRASGRLPEASRPIFRFIVIADRRERCRIGSVVDMAVEAKERLDGFIAGLDLAGDEGTARPEEIADAFRPAFAACLPITIHAGETESAQSIWQAAYHLHADRIGHGLTLSEHPRLAARFRDRGICLELCPSSNREVVGFHDPAVAATAGQGRYPLRALWDAGLPLTLCTDNPGISRTTLADEYLTAARMLERPLSCWEALAMIKQAFVHAFLDSSRKEELLKHCDARIYHGLKEFGGG